MQLLFFILNTWTNFQILNVNFNDQPVILILNVIFSRSLEARTDSRLSAAAQAASAEAKGQKPPPRPIHRYPSWEDRIYQVASEGMKDATGDQMGDSKNNNQDQQNGYGSDINVPVYATVKGVSHKVVHRDILSQRDMTYRRVHDVLFT